MKLPIAFIVIFVFLTALTLYVHLPQNKKETPVTIYTTKDIYYVYKDSIVSESGLRVVDFKAAYIELQTACDLH